ncbi:hypothetical protein [Cutibacterium granulosum]|uniref:Uncharacterized protein n=1 Tax=Cutibacterium granulosum TM11 TaxID=1292373 RepID=A0ACB4UQN1_9ACTN|nr:hypothetical protein [Cutibacterium granulosum]ERF67714.1 hypothetical protein H640_01540 [Cutibacterium granulosum TM11]
MKQLKARRSVGVATALSLSLLGSLSCAAVASADEGPEPATTTSVSASPEAESTTPLLPLGESPSAERTTELFPHSESSTTIKPPSSNASPDLPAGNDDVTGAGHGTDGSGDGEVADGDVNVFLSAGDGDFQAGKDVKVDRSNLTVQVNYDLLSPNKGDRSVKRVFSGSVAWQIVPAGTNPDKGHDPRAVAWGDARINETGKGSVDVSLARLTPGKHYDLVIDFTGDCAVDRGDGTLHMSVHYDKRVTVRGLHFKGLPLPHLKHLDLGGDLHLKPLDFGGSSHLKMEGNAHHEGEFKLPELNLKTSFGGGAEVSHGGQAGVGRGATPAAKGQGLPATGF